MKVYKTAKGFFSAPDIDLGGGFKIRLHRPQQDSQERGGKSLPEGKGKFLRHGKSLQDGKYDWESTMKDAKGVEDRQQILEEYFKGVVDRTMEEGSLSWNMSRMMETLVGDGENSGFEFGEGRGKQKKALKMLMPILMAVGLKVATLGTLSYMAIAVVAKKALLVGITAFLISGFIAVKNLFNPKKTVRVAYHPHDEEYGGPPYDPVESVRNLKDFHGAQ